MAPIGDAVASAVVVVAATVAAGEQPIQKIQD